MANWLQALVGGLAGAGRAGVDYAMQKRELERIEEEKRRAAMERDRVFALNRDQFDYGRTRENLAALSPDANIAGTALETDARRFGVPLRERTRVNSMVEVPATPITAGTAISMPEVGGLPAMPPLPGVSPTPGPLPQGEQTPFTLPSVGKAFAMPETPTTRTVGRMPTAQEQMRQRMAETQLPEYRKLLDTAPPELKPIIAMTIKQLEQGLDPELTVGQAAGLVRPAKPEEDKDLVDPKMRSDFSAALNIPFEQVPERWSAMTPAQRNALEAWEKKHRGVNPQPQVIVSGGGSGDTSVPQEYRVLVSQAIGSRAPAHAKVSAQNTLAQLWASGDTESVNNYIRALAIESEPSTIKERITSRIETVDALKDAAKLLRELKAEGVDTNLMAGGAEKMAQYLGSTGNPRLAALGTQLSTILMNYRRGITGAAFSASEAGEYAKIWPSISNNLALNEAQIEGLARTLQGADASYWRRKLGDKGAELVGAVPSTKGSATPTRKRYNLQGQEIDANGKVIGGGV